MNFLAMVASSCDKIGSVEVSQFAVNAVAFDGVSAMEVSSDGRFVLYWPAVSVAGDAPVYEIYMLQTTESLASIVAKGKVVAPESLGIASGSSVGTVLDLPNEFLPSSISKQPITRQNGIFYQVASDLKAGPTYLFQVVATGSMGSRSANSRVLAYQMTGLAEFQGCIAGTAVGTTKISVSFHFPNSFSAVSILRNGIKVFSTTTKTTTSYLDSGLIEGQLYRYECEGILDGKAALGTTSLEVRTFSSNPPTFLGISSAVAASATAVDLTWAAATGVAAAQFKVYGNLGASVDWTAAPLALVGSGSTSTRVTGLGDELPYVFGVRACSEDAVCEGNTQVRNATTPDGGPPTTTGAATANQSQGQVSIVAPWTAVQGGLADRLVYQRSGPVGGLVLSDYALVKTQQVVDRTVPPTVITVGNLAQATTYHFIVQDRDPTGQLAAVSNSVTVAIGDLTAPNFSGMTGLSAGPVGSKETSLTVSFIGGVKETNDATNGASFYQFLVAFGSADACVTGALKQEISTAAFATGSLSTHVLTGLLSRTLYSVCMKARDSSGNVSVSAPDSQSSRTRRTLDTTQPYFDGIQSLAYDPSVGKLIVTWNPSPSLDALEYKVSVWTTNSPPAAPNHVLLRAASSNTSGTLIGNTDFSFTDNTTYRVLVDACDDAASTTLFAGGLQNCTANLTTQTRSQYVPDVTPPENFSGIALAYLLTTPNQGTVNVAWYPPPSWSGFSGFKIYIVGASDSLTEVKNCPCSGANCPDALTSCVVDGLDARRTYNFHVRAYDQAGNITTYLSAATNRTAKRTSDTTNPTMTTSLNAAATGASVTVSWPEATDNQYASESGAAINYLLYRKAGTTFAAPTNPAADGTLLVTQQGQNFADLAAPGSTTSYYTLCARDSSSNTTCNGFVRNVAVPDMTPPVMTQPITYKVKSDQVFDLGWSVTDNVTATAGIAVQVRRKGASSAADFPSAGDPVYVSGNGLTSVSSEVCGTPNQFLNYSVTATDLAGNSVEKTMSIYCDKVHWTSVPTTTPANCSWSKGFSIDSRFLVWGNGNQDCNGIYDPSTLLWKKISANVKANYLFALYSPSVVWTGSKMIVWGGASYSAPGYFGVATTYGGSNSTAITLGTAPAGTIAPGMSITGNGLPVGTYVTTVTSQTSFSISQTAGTLSGSYYFGVFRNHGEMYDPATDTWTSVSTINAPTPRAWHSAVWMAGIGKMIVWGGTIGGTIETTSSGIDLSDGKMFDPVTNTWSEIPVASGSAPSARYLHSAVAVGTKMVIWGGRTTGWYTNVLNTGGVYDTSNQTWITTPSLNAPSARVYHGAASSGTSMAVYGGRYSDSTHAPTELLASGAIFDPAADNGNGVWTTMSTLNNPSVRAGFPMIWNGSQFIVWGGTRYNYNCNYGITWNHGAQYQPLTDTWTTLAGQEQVIGRWNYAAAWVFGRMMMIGGASCVTTDSRGRALNPSTNLWTDLNAGVTQVAWSKALKDPFSPSIFVTPIGGGRQSAAALFDPSTLTWTNVPSIPNSLINRSSLIGSNRYTGAEAWTGRWYILMDGYNNSNQITRDGIYYDHNSLTWNNMSFTGAPWQREGSSSAWTGTELIVWGGNTYANNTPYNKASSSSGGRYSPETNTWAVMTDTNAPAARHKFLWAWTGTEMLVWGGCRTALSIGVDCGLGYLKNGGKYNPSSGAGTWTEISTLNAPTVNMAGGRNASEYGGSDSASAWTGSKWVIVTNNGVTYSGSMYDPASNTWTSMNMTGGPTTLVYNFSLVAIGDKVYMHGGTGAPQIVYGFDTAINSWFDTGISNNAPFARGGDYQAISTGTQMFLWGGTISNGIYWGNPAGLYTP